MTSPRRFLAAVAVLAALLLTALPLSQASAHLMLAPKRIIFEGRDRSAIVVLLNTDNKPHTYRIGWKLLEVDEDGKGKDKPLDENDPHSIHKMVVFSPRQVRIEPGGRQSIRLSLRRPADLPPGEYRGHLVFASMPEGTRDVEGDMKGISLGLQVTVGMSIPVYIRNGNYAPTDVAIENPVLKPAEGGTQKLDFSIAHTPGTASSYGNVRVFLKQSGKEEQVGLLNRLTVYSEQKKRNASIALSYPAIAGSELRIVYEGADEYQGKILAEKRIVVGG